ncbi:MAG: heme transporter HemC, partial [Dongiaceae bacterium]
WWNTLHQPDSIMRMGGPSIDPSMLVPLLLMAVAFQLFFFTALLARMKAELLSARLRTAMFNRLRGGAAGRAG